MVEGLLLTYPQVQEATGLSEMTVRRLVQAGQLQVVEVGRLRRITVSSLRNWIERIAAGGSSQPDDA
jgi:excisionase family DNA binding protein